MYPHELQTIKKAAKKAGKSLAQFARDRLLGRKTEVLIDGKRKASIHW